MAGIRMTGLVSGMDTESMVQELVKASSTKVDNVKKEKQLLEWKKEAWQSLNTKIYDFYKNELSALKTNGTYKSKKATVNDETKVSVSAKSNASNGTHTVSVKQLASSAYLTGANIKSVGSTFTKYATAGTATNFADMTDASGNNIGLAGQTISIGNGTETLTFELGETGDNGVANIEELNAKLAENGNFKLQAVIKDGAIAFENSSADTDENGDLVGTDYTIEASALGISGTVNYKNDDENGLSASLVGTVAVNKEVQFTSSDVNSGTKLKDLGIAVGTTFSIKGKEFVVDEDTTIAGLASGLSKLGVSASFDDKQGRFYLNASGTGAANDFNLTVSGGTSNALDILGLSTAAGAVKINAKDAIIMYNGVEYTGSTNTFEVNGLSITAKGVTGDYDATTGAFTNDSPLNVEVSADNEGAYDVIKNFVKKYNELIDEMNTLYNEKKTDYEPLTDEERAELSETQIEKWEEKAKQGLLRRDSTIESLLSSMRNILNQGVTVTNEDGTTTRYSLASLGIVTGDYSEKGKLHILGDEDDAAYSAETNKLRQALEEKPEIFAQVFAGTKDKAGLGFQLYSSLSSAMSLKVNRSSAFTVYDNLTMDEEIEDYDDEIEKWEEKLQDLEDKYYDQFSAMEAAMAKLQSQQSYISALMGA